MEALRKTQKKHCSRAITAAIFVGLIFILIGHISVGKGLILGTIFSIINFILMGETLPLKLNKSKRKTFLISTGSILFRYMILAVPLIMALKFEQYNILSVVIGIFLVQIFILAENFLIIFSSARGKQVL
jgi:asparagine N-glycosylation enzyme membrane subunit Stt3